MKSHARGHGGWVSLASPGGWEGGGEVTLTDAEVDVALPPTEADLAGGHRGAALGARPPTRWQKPVLKCVLPLTPHQTQHGL